MVHLLNYFIELNDTIKNFMNNQIKTLEEIINITLQVIKNGNKILICGNGGSAADSQHFAAEFVGRYKQDRNPLPAIALTTDTSLITAISNDYGYDLIFSRQVDALGEEGDILFAISTSGNSKNVIKAVISAKKKKMITVGLLGKDGGKLKSLVDYPIIVPSYNTPRIQEVHQIIIHSICEEVEKGVFGDNIK